MEMPAFNQITLLYVIILVPDVIAATAIIKAAVAVIIQVVVAAIIVHTIPLTDAAEAPGWDLIHVTHHNHGHLDDTTASHNLAKDINLTHAAGVDLDHWVEDTVIIPIWSLQIANVPGMLWGLPERNDTELIEAVKCSHQLSKPSHETSNRSSCQNCYMVKYVIDVLNIVALINRSCFDESTRHHHTFVDLYVLFHL